ncbi:MAG: NAD(P)-dependent oxidoreductase [Myxococcota bacterium]
MVLRVARPLVQERALPLRWLITGSEGLVGRGLTAALRSRGHQVDPFDLVRGEDVRDLDQVRAAVGPVDGVVHLAAVSRVAWGERDPEGCVSTNVDGTRNVLEAARQAKNRPLVLFASSREVYGEPRSLPVGEDAPLAPLNVYARTKVDGEALVGASRAAGLRAGVVRLSNVYGDTVDHADRVVPAFVRAAVRGEGLRVEGSGHTFDFTHLDDVVRGLVLLLGLTHVGAPLPPVHLVSGRGTTLGELAALAIAAGGGGEAHEAPPRTYDVARFVGDPSRARERLGWTTSTPLEQGLARLADAFRREVAPQPS